MGKREIIVIGRIKINRGHIIYLRDDILLDKSNRRMYIERRIVHVPANRLNRAYALLQTITDQHLPDSHYSVDKPRVPMRGISQHFHWPNGIDAYVYGPESLGKIQHIKINYGATLPLLQMIESLNLPSPIPQEKEHTADFSPKALGGS